MDDEIPPVKEEIIVPVVVVDDDVCIDFVKEVLHKESLSNKIKWSYSTYGGLR